MNPIEKALDTADKIIDANRELERLSALSAHGVKIVDTHNPDVEIQQSLVVAFDVTGWTRQQIDSLYAAASAQGEAVEDLFFDSPADDQSHPHAESIYEIVEHDGTLDLSGVLHVGLGF